MHINDPDFARRRILIGSNEYSPKKRWDQNVFGSERRMLMDHVQKTLKLHENDGDIIEKFKKQAQEMKQRKRREKFPYLFNSSTSQQNLLLSYTKNNPPTNYLNQFEQPLKPSPQQPQQFKQRQSFARPFQAPTLLPPISHFPQFAIPTANPFELQARIQYERTIAQKDLQIYKKEQKIKRQKKEINRLYRQLKDREKDDQLQKYMKSQEQIKKMNQMLTDMKDQLTSRNSLLNNTNNLLIDAHQQADRRRNKSELFLNNYNSMALVKDHIRDRKHHQKDNGLITVKELVPTPVKDNNTGRKSVLLGFNQTPSSYTKNPEIEYSPQTKNNRSSVFEKVPLYNPTLLKSNSLNEHLDQLKNYNKRLQYLHDYNKTKLSQIA